MAQLAEMPVTTNYKAPRASRETSHYAKRVPVTLAVLLMTNPQWPRLGEDHTEWDPQRGLVNDILALKCPSSFLLLFFFFFLLF